MSRESEETIRESSALRVLTVQEAARLLQINEAGVRRLIRSGELAASRIGRLWRIRIEAIEKLLDEKVPAP